MQQNNNNNNNNNNFLNNNNYFQENNNISLPRVPSDPLHQRNYFDSFDFNNNNNNNNFFYQTNPSSFTNINRYINNFNFPNNSFTMNGKNGWICPNCKNFNYESKIFF